mgnify:CR=1 FL=1
MKKLYIDIRFAKCLLALTAGWLMAGCSAEDELGNGSAAQQLSMTPMVNDLQKTRVKEEENLHEKTLSSLDFKMFEPTPSELRIDRQFSTPEENKAKELGSGNWKSALHLDVDKTYPYYAVANAKEDLKGKNLKDLLASTQQDDDIWKPATMVNDKKFLMSSQGEYTITQDPEQNIPVQLVRAAAKIKLNISSTVKDYNIKEVKWKFINYNTNTAIFAGQPATPNIIKDNQENKATAEKDEKGNDIYKVTTYSYSTTWNGKDDMPQFVADVIFESADAKTTITKHLVIPVRDPQGDKKLERNYIYTVNAVIKYLDTKTDIDYDDDLGYLKWQITKWTQGEKTEVKGDKADYLIVYPTTISMKGMDDNKIDESIKWMASAPCKIEDYAYYSFDSNGTIHENDNSINQPGGAESQQNTQTGDGNCGYIKISDGYPAHNTVVYCTFNLCVTGSDKKQKIIVKKYPSIYSLNVESTGTLNQWQNKRLYTIQHSVTKSNNSYSVAKPSDKNDNTVSPAFIIASTNNSRLQSISSNDEAKNYCEHYTESATTRKGKNLDLSGWRLPTKEEVKKIISLQSYDKVIPKELLLGESYWTFDGEKSDDQSNTSFKGTYVRCVHDLTPDEIEKIEDQGIE